MSLATEFYMQNQETNGIVMDRNQRLRNAFITIFLIVFIANIAIVAWVRVQAYETPTFYLTSQSSLLVPSVCPHTLQRSVFSLEVNKPAFINIAYYATSIPYLGSDQLTTNSPALIRFSHVWEVPDLPPGDYIFRVVVNLIGESTPTEEIGFYFRISENCK